MFSLKFGADIEFFALDKGKVTDAESVIKDTKLVTDKRINKDGIQLEINPSPQTCREAFIRRITEIFGSLQASGVTLSNSQSVTIRKSKFDKIKDEDKQMGCLPDINVYTMKENNIPGDYQNLRERTAGGHIHVSSPDILIGIYNRKFPGNKNVFRLCFDPEYLNLHEMSKPIKITADRKLEKFIYEYLSQNSFAVEAIGHEHKIDNPYHSNRRVTPTEHDKYMKRIREIVFLVKDDLMVKIIETPAFNAMTNPSMTIKTLDLFVGIISVMMDNRQKQIARRKYYGKAGAFRYTRFGLEYRTLSNFWVNKPEYISLYLGLVRDSIIGVHDHKEVMAYISKNEKRIVDTINNVNIAEAKKIFNEFIVPYAEIHYSDASINSSPLAYHSLHYLKHEIMNPKEIDFNDSYHNKKNRSGWGHYVSHKMTWPSDKEINEEWDKW